MKSVNNKVRNVLTLVLVIALMVLSKYSFADTTERKVPATPVSVKYIGSINNQDLIQVEIENNSDDSFEISFVDKDGIELYSEIFNTRKISKKFLLDIPDLNFKNLQLIVTSKKTFQSQTFSLAKNRTVFENVIVAKID
jgi:adenylate cyclase